MNDSVQGSVTVDLRLVAVGQLRGPNVGAHRKLLLARLLRKRPVYLGAWRTLAIAPATASEH
jgi:hypothetical protein